MCAGVEVEFTSALLATWKAFVTLRLTLLLRKREGGKRNVATAESHPHPETDPESGSAVTEEMTEALGYFSLSLSSL